VALFDAEATEALARAIRRKLMTGPSTGALPYDLASAVIEVAVERLVGEDECCIADLNVLFGLDLEEPEWEVQLDDVGAATWTIERVLHGEQAIIGMLSTVTHEWSVVASSPGGTATMMSDDGIGLYQFTLDDRVYFFTLGEPDVCDTEWWWAHDVGDTEARAKAVRNGRSVIGLPADRDES
jgi:hypothetical protein